MSKFKIGDVCVWVGLINWPELNGTECEITKELHWSVLVDGRSGWVREGPCYGVKWCDGRHSLAEPHNLKPKRPPSWDSWLFDTSKVKDEKPEDEPIYHVTGSDELWKGALITWHNPFAKDEQNQKLAEGA